MGPDFDLDYAYLDTLRLLRYELTGNQRLVADAFWDAAGARALPDLETAAVVSKTGVSAAKVEEIREYIAVRLLMHDDRLTEEAAWARVKRSDQGTAD